MADDASDLVFVGFNGRVATLDSQTGELVWQWKAPKPWGGYVTLLPLDAQRLIVSVNGYTYALDPATGEQLWYNPLYGFGTGVTSLASLRGSSSSEILLAAAEQAAAAAHSTSSTANYQAPM